MLVKSPCLLEVPLCVRAVHHRQLQRPVEWVKLKWCVHQDIGFTKRSMLRTSLAPCVVVCRTAPCTCTHTCPPIVVPACVFTKVVIVPLGDEYMGLDTLGGGLKLRSRIVLSHVAVEGSLGPDLPVVVVPPDTPTTSTTYVQSPVSLLGVLLPQLE